MADEDLSNQKLSAETNNLRVDSITKLFGVVATIAAGLSGAAFSIAQYYKSWYDYEKSVKDSCTSNYKSMMEFVDKTTKKESDIKGAVAVLLKDCYKVDEITQLLVFTKKSEDKIVPPKITSDFTPERWVAVGFPPEDLNFYGRGKADPKALKKDDVIIANTDVFIRKGVANWSNPIGVIERGKEATVIEVKPVPAGKMTQIWARVLIK